MQPAPTLLIVIKTTTVLLGSVITFRSWTAHRRLGSDALRALAIGFGTVTFGAILGGFLHQFIALAVEEVVIVQSSLTATGFAVITYSLYMHDATIDDRNVSIQEGEIDIK
ncbi:MAG: hypothetical protein SVG88_11885 [Halobacteriales archaeon]|nr:hypothetical protein [Halobacteriales archaeon]